MLAMQRALHAARRPGVGVGLATAQRMQAFSQATMLRSPWQLERRLVLARGPTGQATATAALARRANLWTSRPCLAQSSSTSSSSSSATKAVREAASKTNAERRQEMVDMGKSHWGKLKELWHKYGLVAVGTYLSMYGIVLGSIYVAIEQGWVSTKRPSRSADQMLKDGETPDFNLVTATNKVVTLAENLGVAQYLDLQRVNPKTGTFVIAWVATKFTEPLRLALTLAITPRVARIFGRVPKLPKAPKA